MTIGNLKNMGLTVEHDPAVNAFAFHFSDEPVAETVEFSDSVLVDIDVQRRPVTLEVLGLDQTALERAAADFKFTEQLPVITSTLKQI